MSVAWHSFSAPQIYLKLKSSERGLSIETANARLKTYGRNVLPEEKPRSAFQLFFSQFQSPLIYILLAASATVFFLGETIDGSIILGVLIFNAVAGTIQEGRAQNTLRALRRFAETKAVVLRDGTERIISDLDLVPGDVIILQEGEKVPADARVFVSQNLKADEASLTGESEPVHKVVGVIKNPGAEVPERRNMVFKGTNIAAGNGRAVVVATGTESVIGKIAKEISSIDSEIPLKVNIRYLSRAIIIAVVSIGAVIFFAGVGIGHTAKEMFTTVVSLSVSIIPEGLPIVMTLVLATGVWRMSKRNALVKKLQAVEALGQARVIAVDKTGTITKNELVIRSVWTDGREFSIGGVGYEAKGEIRLGEVPVDAANHEELLLMGKAASYSAAARLSYIEAENRWRVSGDPTEAAMLVLAEKIGFHKEELLSESPLIAEIPFDYKLKYHATLNKIQGGNLLTVIGAPEVVLSHSAKIRFDGKDHAVSKKDKEELESVYSRMSESGLRVLAVGMRKSSLKTLDPESIGSLTFIGFLGMQDVLRPEVSEAMRRAGDAGIRVVMITGDHKLTARAIAREAGIYRTGDAILTGGEIDAMPAEELLRKLSSASVFARVTPEHKLRIINAYKGRGEIVAMTGDGVNDAPSLVAADLGVAMGKIGTEVAKEASDIVLLDDNFVSIISAVEEGRSIYKTIKKVILYLFSTSAGEVLVIAGALFLGYPLPLLAAQIIWLNFVTDGFLDVALAMDPKEKGLLAETFEHPKRYLVDSLMVHRMMVMAIPMMIGTLVLFQKYASFDLMKAQTIALTTLAAFQWFNAWNCRSEKKSIFRDNPLSNLYLVGATAFVIVLQAAAIYTPVMQRILRTTPLDFSEWLVIVPIAASIIAVEEIRKYFARRTAPVEEDEKRFDKEGIAVFNQS